jgi:hypothetical protein
MKNANEQSLTFSQEYKAITHYIRPFRQGKGKINSSGTFFLYEVLWRNGWRYSLWGTAVRLSAWIQSLLNKLKEMSRVTFNLFSGSTSKEFLENIWANIRCFRKS